MELTKTPLGQIIKIIIILILIALALWFITTQGRELVQFFRDTLEAMRNG